MDFTPKFVAAFGRLQAAEGGYVNHPDDTGGATNFGVTQRAWDAFCIDTGRPRFSVQALTKSDAMVFYREVYWAPLGLERLPQRVAFEILDTCVNAGIRAGVLCAQRAFNFLRTKSTPALAEDGHIGPMTRNALISMANKYETALVNAMNGEQYCYYKALVVKDDRYRSFARGWATRVSE